MRAEGCLEGEWYVCVCAWGDQLTFHVNKDPEEILQGKLCLD